MIEAIVAGIAVIAVLALFLAPIFNLPREE
jgi:hypothetical protein